jgi:hypothetical protein
MAWWATALAFTAAACGRGRATTDTGAVPAPAPAQEFTRAVAAMSARTVQAAVQVFGSLGVPVATADEAGGFVQSVPLDLAADWGGVPAAQRVNCVNGAPPGGQLRLTVQVHSTATGSAVTLQSLPLTATKGGANKSATPSTCVLRSEFLTSVLDSIATRAGTP